MYNRVIKGGPHPNGEASKESATARRVIPERLVRMERHKSSGGGHAPQMPAGSLAQGSKPGLQSYMPLSAKLDLVRGSASVVAINQLVEERVRKFEERFQQEKEQAYSEGLRQGEEKGYQRGLTRAGELEKAFNKLGSEFGIYKEKLFKELEGAAGRLALAMAEAVIGEAAATSSDKILEQNLRRCLAAMKGSGRVTIRINPIDYDFASENTKILESGRDKFDFSIEPDPSIAPGGCFLETSSGAVDGRLESQFEILKDTFLQV